LTTAGQATAPVDRLAPWARFAVGLDDTWQELRARIAGAERAAAISTASEEGTVTEAARVRFPVPSSPKRDGNPSRSEMKARSGSRDGTGSQAPSRGSKPAGSPANGVGRTAPSASERNAVHSGDLHVLPAIDRAIAELGESLPRASGSHRIGLPPADQESAAITQLAVGSLALSMIRERARECALRPHERGLAKPE
jgi:hypothetical protein